MGEVLFLSRRRLLQLGGLAALTVATGCATSAEEGGDAAATPFVFASTSITNSLDPLIALSSVGTTFTTQVYDPLVGLGAEGKAEPALATAWKQVDDLTVEFTLREGVVFHEGGAFDAAAVVANIERVLSDNPAFAARKGEMGFLKGAEAVDAKTVRITTSEPDPVLLNRLSRLHIVDPAIFAKDPAKIASGTGPFKVAKYEVNKSIDLEAFPRSWRKPGAVASARLVAIPDSGTLTTALRSGEIDAVFGLPPAVAAQLKDFTVQAPPAGSCAILSMIPAVEEKLGDKNVRIALNLAIDKDEFVKEGLSGFGEVPTGQLLQPGYPGYDESLKGYGFDVAKAKELLAGAGADGLTLNIATTALFKQQAEIAAGYLTAVGIKSEVIIQDLATFITSLLGKSEVPLLYWQTDYFDLKDIASVSRFGPQPKGVQSHFENDDYTSLFAKSGTELDPDARAATIREMAGILNEEAGVVFLAWPKTVYVHGKDVDLGLTPNGNADLADSKKS
ncbi:peptide/nickel transport system substrate-binding protein [Actinocorallia herbida]|uniref:Peptide/nickel transport system substrate-binding protein n=1 Tax=Actinocorallia herbida TaxID=58109 RepID=A0A3N1CYH4_9ACTN|nr:ABC transporter substrate-binding protein [Actinocorallia herbida]ROO86315.1 peptide/nickel transport system substrate-binding protein [Actinocorallia herbida]